MIIRTATAEEVAQVASRLRPADEREVETATGLDPVDALSLAPLDTTYTIRPYRLSEPVCLFGLCPISDTEATVWLVGTDELPRVAKALVGELPHWLRAWSQRYALSNYADSRNELHHRYLRKLGFSFGEAVVIRGVPFYRIDYIDNLSNLPRSETPD